MEDGVTTKYYYTGSVILYTADADNNKISGNIPTPDGEIIATRDYSYATDSEGNPNEFAANYYFYHYDIRGSVTTLLKPDATLEQGYTYDEFGNSETVSETSLLTNEISYTGAISDSTTGLTYMNARYYNPVIGAFTSQDTYYGSAYSPWTQHLYSYTGGNPVNYIDPTGHMSLVYEEVYYGLQNLLTVLGATAALTAVKDAVKDAPGVNLIQKVSNALAARLVIALFGNATTASTPNATPAPSSSSSTSNGSDASGGTSSGYTSSSGRSASGSSSSISSGYDTTFDDLVVTPTYTSSAIDAGSILASTINPSISFAKSTKKIPSKLLTNDGRLNLNLFNNPNGQKQPKGGRSILGPMGYQLIKDLDQHRGSVWKLLTKAGERIASIAKDGTIVGK